MTAASLLDDLTRRGFRLRPHGDKLAISPADLLTDADREAILLLKRDILALLRPIPPAESIIQTCRRYGVALRLAEDGALVVGRSDMNGKEPALWLSLAMAIETHLPAITALVAAGWHLTANVKAAA
jgi:tubulysin polyketide synthase-like protein